MKRLRLAIFDIDGTLRQVPDPWLHLHRHLGTAQQGDRLYNQWQQGQITYPELCRRDAELWRGVPRQQIVASLHTNPLRRGAYELSTWLRARRIPCVGISTGLSIFHEYTARELGLERVECNVLGFQGDICDGTLSLHVHEDSKLEHLPPILAHYQVSLEETVVFGDGEADIPLLQAAGFGVAICPRHPGVRNAADWVIASEPIDGITAILEKYFCFDAPKE